MRQPSAFIACEAHRAPANDTLGRVLLETIPLPLQPKNKPATQRNCQADGSQRNWRRLRARSVCTYQNWRSTDTSAKQPFITTATASKTNVRARAHRSHVLHVAHYGTATCRLAREIIALRSSRELRPACTDILQLAHDSCRF